MWTNPRVILFIERCWAIWAYWAPATVCGGCCVGCWVVGLKVMLQNPRHEIANSIFNLIQRTGSQVLICTVCSGPASSEETVETRYFIFKWASSYLAFLSANFSVYQGGGGGVGERYVLLLLHIKYICIFYDDSLGVSLSSDLTCDDDG